MLVEESRERYISCILNLKSHATAQKYLCTFECQYLEETRTRNSYVITH